VQNLELYCKNHQLDVSTVFGVNPRWRHHNNKRARMNNYCYVTSFEFLQFLRDKGRNAQHRPKNCNETNLARQFGGLYISVRVEIPVRVLGVSGWNFLRLNFSVDFRSNFQLNRCYSRGLYRNRPQARVFRN